MESEITFLDAVGPSGVAFLIGVTIGFLVGVVFGYMLGSGDDLSGRR